MKIVIIGSGNLATQLALALKDANQDIVQIFSRTSAHAKELADKIGCAYTASLEAVLPDELYILAVKDDALAALAANLCAARTDALFLHTAGSMPMDLFKGHALQYGVLYPMQTFSKTRRVNFREIPCFIEASSPSALAIIRTLAESISDHVVDCDSAAVLACNLTNHCYRLAERVLEAEQIDFRLFLPLIEETARKVRTLSPKDAQTGPMVRYDQNVMQMQMAMLPDDRTREIYRLMAESIHDDATTL